MANSHPSRITQPSAKLSSENAGSHQLLAHRHAIANARQEQVAKEPLPELPASRNITTSASDSISDGALDHELGSTSDATIPNPKKRSIVVSKDDESDDSSLTSTQQSNNPCPKKKKKSKKRTSKGM